MSHWTIQPVNKFDYWLALYHGLVTRFPVKNTQAMCVRFVYERRRYATMVKIRHGLATLNSSNSVVYCQKHKVWVLVFLVRTSEYFETKLSRFGELFCFATRPHLYRNSMQETLLSISSNGLGNKTVISCLFVVKSNATVDDLRPRARVHQVVHGTSGYYNKHAWNKCILHTNNQGSRPCNFRQDFFRFSLYKHM